MSKHMYSTANLTDKELKEQGNRLFSLRKFEDAMNCYTKAIVSVKMRIELHKQYKKYDIEVIFVFSLCFYYAKYLQC